LPLRESNSGVSTRKTVDDAVRNMYDVGLASERAAVRGLLYERSIATANVTCWHWKQTL
jgi:hypothetical protein